MTFCIECGNPKVEAFGRCASCNHQSRKLERVKEKKVTPIKRVSDKRSRELQVYAKLKAHYLKIYPCCEVADCHNKSIDIHHSRGRENGLLTNVDFFLAVCRECHTKITTDSAWAVSQGYSILRTTV